MFLSPFNCSKHLIRRDRAWYPNATRLTTIFRGTRSHQHILRDTIYSWLYNIKLPAFFLATLICAFWLSFTLVGDNQPIAPTTWPLTWLVMALIVLLNPLPIMFKSSRFWLMRKTGKLLLSGTKTVEVRIWGIWEYHRCDWVILLRQFTDFWLGYAFLYLLLFERV